MSDEYQPNEVVEPEAEVKQPEPKQEAPKSAEPAPATVDASNSDATDLTEEAPSPAVVSLADLGSSNNGSEAKGPGFMATAAGFLRSYGWIAAIVVVVFLVALLFLPPISLASRIGSGGYTALSSDEPVLAHEDGLDVTRTGEANGKLRVKLGSIPRADFTVDKVDESLGSAIELIPTGLAMKGPFFTIDVKSNNGTSADLTVDIPLDSEPWETLGLYSWDGTQWVWIPSTLDSTNGVLVAETDVLPSSVTVMQTTSDGRYIAAFVEQLPSGGIIPELEEIDVAGFLVGTVGGVNGDPSLLPLASAGGQAIILPVVRNWVPGNESNWGLVSEMLTQNGNRPVHVENLTNVTLAGGYPGLVVDYRGAPVEDQEIYTTFVTELAAKFQENGLKLAVVVETPSPSLDHWDTGGYDWQAIGAAVDELRVVMPSDPEAYRAGGTVDTMFQWALTQVERRKLMPMYATLSTDGTEFVTLEDVYAAIGSVSTTGTVPDTIEPGTSVDFALSPAVQVTADAELGTTGIAVNDKTYWLGTGQWLRTRMDIASRYRLGGVVLWTLYDEGNDDSILAAVSDFVNDTMAVPDSVPEVTWRITDPTGNTTDLSSQLTQPQLSWTAPEITGTYTINALVAGLDKGSMSVTVIPAVAVVTDTLEGGTEETVAGADPEAETGGDELAAGFVADVTVPDNTHFEKGEAFTKTWRMKNTGTEDWPETTVMIFAGDDSLSEATEVAVGAVAAGAEVDISVDMAAPDEDGSFKSTWKLNTGEQDISGGASYVLISVGEVADVPPTTVAPVSGGGAFELGGHVQNEGYPYATQMHYSGMTWSKVQIRWKSDAAGSINNAHANGFKVQLSALGSASQVTQAGFTEEYAAWVAGMAAAGADAIEVWNEPNLSREWQDGQISPQAYTSFLCTAYNAIKAANPSTAVISAAPAPTGFFGGCGTSGCDDQPWMEGLWNAGAANCMDYIGAHYNSGATAPSATIGHPASPSSTHHSWFFMPQTQLYYNIFQGTKQLFYTEMGYVTPQGTCGNGLPSTFAWGNGTTVANQAAWLAEAVQLSINTGMVKSVIVWNIDFQQNHCGDCNTSTTFCDPQKSYGIIRPDGSCPSCDALHNLLGTR